MRNLFVLIFLILLSNLFSLELAEQFTGFPISLSDTTLGSPSVITVEDNVFLGMGGIDSNFYIVSVHDSGSFVSIPISGPISGKTVSLADRAFVFQTTTGDLYSVATDGTINPGFPLDLGEESQYSSPAVIDCHGIVCLVDNTVFFVTESGESRVVSTFESEYGAVADPAFGDIDGDGMPEIVAVGWDKIYVFSLAGDLISPFPVELEGSWRFSYSPPVITDVEQDGTMDIVIGGHQTADDYWGGVFLFRAETGLILNYPVAIPDTGSWIYSNIVPADVDNDTIVELCVIGTDSRVRILNQDRGSFTIWEDEFYVSEGSLESGMVMASMNGNRTPDFVFLSSDTGRVVRRQPDGFNADDSLDYSCSDHYDRQSPIIFESGEHFYVGAASTLGNINLWQMEHTIPQATYKWLNPGCDRGGSFVNPEPPTFESIRDNDGSFTIRWNEPLATGLPIVSTRLYVQQSDTSETLELLYEGSSFYHTFAPETDSLTVYITCVYANGTESNGISHKLLPDEGISEFKPNTLALRAYPNPFNSSVNIESGIGILTIYDLQGKEIQKISTQSEITRVTIDGAAGIYNARFVSSDNRASSIKLLYIP